MDASGAIVGRANTRYITPMRNQKPRGPSYALRLVDHGQPLDRYTASEAALYSYITDLQMLLLMQKLRTLIRIELICQYFPGALDDNAECSL